MASGDFVFLDETTGGGNVTDLRVWSEYSNVREDRDLPPLIFHYNTFYADAFARLKRLSLRRVTLRPRHVAFLRKHISHLEYLRIHDVRESLTLTFPELHCLLESRHSIKTLTVIEQGPPTLPLETITSLFTHPDLLTLTLRTQDEESEWEPWGSLRHDEAYLPVRRSYAQLLVRAIESMPADFSSSLTHVSIDTNDSLVDLFTESAAHFPYLNSVVLYYSEGGGGARILKFMSRFPQLKHFFVQRMMTRDWTREAIDALPIMQHLERLSFRQDDCPFHNATNRERHMSPTSLYAFLTKLPMLVMLQFEESALDRSEVTDASDFFKTLASSCPNLQTLIVNRILRTATCGAADQPYSQEVQLPRLEVLVASFAEWNHGDAWRAIEWMAPRLCYMHGAIIKWDLLTPSKRPHEYWEYFSSGKSEQPATGWIMNVTKYDFMDLAWNGFDDDEVDQAWWIMNVTKYDFMDLAWNGFDDDEVERVHAVRRIGEWARYVARLRSSERYAQASHQDLLSMRKAAVRRFAEENSWLALEDLS